jgi:hypothetical protein
MNQVLRILLPFLVSLFQVITAALALGMIPALWCIAVRRNYGMLARWTVFFLIIATAAAYGLPMAMSALRDSIDEGAFKTGGVYFAYFVGILLTFFLLPEPMRIAKHRLRQPRGNSRDERAEGAVRVRRVRRRRSRSGSGAE